MAMAKRVTSRLAKKQKKELTKQTIVLILLSIIVGLLFLLIILPSGVRLFFDILDKQTDIHQADTIPPQPPIVSAPPEFTNQDKLQLSGYGESESKIRLEVNNQVQDTVAVDDSDQFEVIVHLSSGENIVSLFSIDSQGNKSQHQQFFVTLDKEPPEIEIDFPEDEAEFDLKKDEVIQIEGTTEPKSKVYVNNRLTYADSDGVFSTRFQLSSGENTIEIRVLDQAGNENETEITVYYRR